ncbi:flavin monoamine oxidase family protein [Neobacillus bataviensis]|uniref:flavin monoamine oxidase family protein n=1 Tax=Neobacillus bataviensis TaxID=220685 RepID=UPI001CBD05ED|nr:NAD(P)/FAD-dependent oxidoreductase [Neobacillus bataviensis]
MARTPLASILQKSFALASAELEKQTSTGQAITSQKAAPETQKKQAIKYNRDGKNNPKIVIVGAGLAGLTAAYRLKQEGILSTVYEATDRVGGRCWTRRGFFKDGQIVERGGELIDTGHKEIQELAKEFGLELDHLIKSESMGTKPFYFFDQSSYSFQEVTNDFLSILPKLQRDLDEVGETTLYNRFSERGYELDHMSIVDYINEIVPGGIESKFGKLLEVAYTLEFGADANLQSALNLLYLLGFTQKDQFQMYGDSDECFHIRGGNDQLPTMLAKSLDDGQIQFHSQLVKIEQFAENEIKLVFRNRERDWEVVADKVILAIPFKILKTIDFENASFRKLKKLAIEELGMGVNTKLHAQFVERFWNDIGNNGETFTDTGYQQTFESTRAQQGNSGILVNFTGGKTAAKQFALTEAEINETTKQFLDKLNHVLPGSVSNWNGLATVDHWLSNQWTKGSYSYWKVGQYTKFAGVMGEREGNIFFAGEHTSIHYAGYLNGAVESGEKAAREVIDDIFNKE